MALEQSARRIQPLGLSGKMIDDGVIVSTDDTVRLEDVIVDVRHQRGFELFMPQVCNSHGLLSSLRAGFDLEEL